MVTYLIGRLNKRLGWWWSKLHVRLYRLVHGRLVGQMRGRPIVLLTTTGRSSGLGRTVPVTVMRDATGYVAIASYQPQWFRNLLASPEAQIQDRDAQLDVVAAVDDDPGTREAFRAFYPALTRIEAHAQAAAGVPIVRFTRVTAGPPTP